MALIIGLIFFGFCMLLSLSLIRLAISGTKYILETPMARLILSTKKYRK